MAYATLPTFIILGPPHISGMGEARDFKFGVPIDLEAYKPENAKVGQKARGLRHVTYFIIFVLPTASVERLNLQTSNLVHRLSTRLLHKTCKIRSSGCM